MIPKSADTGNEDGGTFGILPMSMLDRWHGFHCPFQFCHVLTWTRLTARPLRRSPSPLQAAQIERDPWTSGEICLWGTYCIPLYLADRFMDIDGPTNRPWWFPSSPSPSSSHRICLSNHSFPLSPVGRIECNCDSSRLARRWSHSNVILSAICFTEDITADLHITFFLEIRTRSVPCASRPHPLSLSSWRWRMAVQGERFLL